jgi:transposase
MIRPDFAKWGQTPADIYQLSLKAPHARTRERFQALHMIGTRQVNATEWAQQINRRNQTVMGWVHQYNEQGPQSLYYQRTGGRPPLLLSHKKRRSSRPSAQLCR